MEHARYEVSSASLAGDGRRTLSESPTQSEVDLVVRTAPAAAGNEDLFCNKIL